MRFRPWPKPEPYRDTSRKRAAFKRKQRLEREALPLFAEMIAAGQHGVDEEMARRHVWWDEREREQRTLRAGRWREARVRLFALPDDLRSTVRNLWRGCPYPADPAYLLDLLHQIAVGRVDPLMLQQQSTPDYSADIAAALATQGGYLSIGRGGFTLHYRAGAMLSGNGCEPIKIQCIAAGLPVIDSRCVAFDIVVHVTLRGPLVAVGRDPDPAHWHGLSYAPLQAVAAQYAAAGAEIWNIPEVDTVPMPANRRIAP